MHAVAKPALPELTGRAFFNVIIEKIYQFNFDFENYY